MSKKEKKTKTTEFSKDLLNQEKVLVWIVTLVALGITVYCVARNFTGALPWLAAIVGFPWSAYGVSQACYYNKSKAENTKGGIKFETVMQSITSTSQCTYDFDTSPYDEDGEGKTGEEDLDPFGPI